MRESDGGRGIAERIDAYLSEADVPDDAPPWVRDLIDELKRSFNERDVSFHPDEASISLLWSPMDIAMADPGRQRRRSRKRAHEMLRSVLEGYEDKVRSFWADASMVDDVEIGINLYRDAL